LMHRRNNIPRKSLNYHTPLEEFLSHVTDEQLSTFF
ncbi:MAG: IS30 family transposase, partial [Limosilactobacillus sp.]|nr:IS30 family transposase [Limosilactobacillus sp.]